MDLKEFSLKLKALSDPHRLLILYLLRERPACVCELASLFSVSQPTLTRHLQKLESANFIVSQRFKNYQIYTLSPKDSKINTLLEPIFAILDNIPEVLELKKRFLEKIPHSPQ